MLRLSTIRTLALPFSSTLEGVHSPLRQKVLVYMDLKTVAGTRRGAVGTELESLGRLEKIRKLHKMNLCITFFLQLLALFDAKTPLSH